MGKLSDWSEGKPDWVKDALQRAAVSPLITQQDIESVYNRVSIEHGIVIDGDHPCINFDEDSLLDVETTPDNVVLCSVGPLQGLDRLAADQVLKFALDGITIIFGDNGAGKSGYTRAMRHLTRVRQDTTLEGNVFAIGPRPDKSITFTYRQDNAEPVSHIWREGDNKPGALSGITLLDTDNLRVYVDGKNDILYMPPEAACVGRLAEIYQAVAAKFSDGVASLTRQVSLPFGGGYRPQSQAATLVSKLAINTREADLPSEKDLREYAIWSDEYLSELIRLRTELSTGPSNVAALCDRIASACETTATTIATNHGPLLDGTIAADSALILEKTTKRQMANALAREQIGAQPIAATGSETWQGLFRIARQFAAEAGMRALNESFEEGDACPLCQQALSEDAVLRLSAFDAYVEGVANREADKADQEVVKRIVVLKALTFNSAQELQSLLAEAATQGPIAEDLVSNVIAYSNGLKARRDARVAQLQASLLDEIAPLPASPLDRLNIWSKELREQASKLRTSDNRTQEINDRIIELEDQQRIYNQIDEMVTRRNQLANIHRAKKCESALNTRSLSALMTSLRRDLTSPALEARIREEIDNFGLQHIPLRFSDETLRGASYFEIGLATDQASKKSRILSEGEQRALSLACFMAETHVAGRRSGIILDDPVTSLDHTRIRRVARRIVDEAAKGRQLIIFTHNLVFYHELMLACTDRKKPVPALPCLIEQSGEAEFGFVSIDSAPWLARKVKEREITLQELIDATPAQDTTSSDQYRRACTRFYAALRETWERAVEEIVLNDVVRRFGSNVGTLRLGGVDVSDDDYSTIHRAMSRASEHSGHDQAAARQIDMPSKKQMQDDLNELIEFRKIKTKSNEVASRRRKDRVENPPKAIVT